MTSKNLYLKSNLIVEPLINQWYAWSYLVSPATAAMYMHNSHIQIMQSFIDAPQVHVSALKNPEMIGGPFVNYNADKVDEIKALLARTKAEQAHLFELAQAIKALDELLRNEACGYSLEPLYQKIPERLKGYVELVYDSNNFASIRFIEGLIYKSQYYNPSSQTVALYLANEDARSFVLSTPRLKDEQCLHLQIPFSDRRLDQLFQMRKFPQSYAQIKDIFSINDEDDALFLSFFTEEPPPEKSNYDGNSVRIRYFGHACVLIETKEVSILCDPLISYQHQTGIPRYTYIDLPETIDYALITHNHQDHCLFETLLQLRHKIKNLVVPKSNKGTLIDPSLKLALQSIGFCNVLEVDELETIETDDCRIVSLPVLGEHGDLNISTKAAYLIEVKERKILCAADSNNIEPKLYQHLYRLIGDLDVIFIGMECDGAPFTWAYGSLLTKQTPRAMAQTRRLDGSNFERAVQLVEQFNPQQVYIYAMGQEPWLTYITSIQYTDDSRPILESTKLVEACRSRNIISERLFGSKEIFLEENSAISSHYQKQSEESIKDTVALSLNEFLSSLCRLDVKVWADGDRLRCNAPKGTLTPNLKAQLQERKAEILNFLKRNNTADVAALNAEAVLDPTITPASSAPLTPPTLPALFLTGATGFLGAFLLYELLQQSSADIYCLVRSSTESGKQQIQNHLESYALWNESFSSRIVPVIGDLSQPLLGLSEEQFIRMADEIDVIYHNGARVHHTSNYSSLKATNVLGTQEVLRLASQSKVKPVHFISTLSVFSAANHSGVRVQEQDSIDTQVPSGGYAQSKWVAEKLVTIARSRGLPVCIYRPGPISGHSQTGVFNVNDFLYRLMLGCLQLGSAPAGEMLLDILPVDYVSKAIVHLSRKQESLGKAFHLVHPHPVSSDLLFNHLRSRGYQIQRISYEKWHADLLHIANNSPEHALYPLVSLFSSSGSKEQSSKAVLKFDCQNTLDGLADTSIVCPPIDSELLSTYLSYLIRSGHLTSLQQNQVSKTV